jgi:type VI secretion system VasD/TssJ family lipoprotein
MVEVSVAREAAFVGVMAAFRDSRNTQWRAIVPSPREGLTVAVERSRVVVAAAAEDN